MRKSIQMLVAIAAIVSFGFTNPKEEPRQINVVIDAGHGGNDFGAKHDAHTEKDIVEQITKKIREQQKDENVTIHFTRLNDEFMDLKSRTDFINKIKPDLVLSLHVNSNANTNASGMRLFVAKDENAHNTTAKTYAEKLGAKFTQNHNLKVGEISEAPFFVLKNSEAPAIIVEIGFLSNPEDRKIMTDDTEQSRIANTIVAFINEIE